MSDSLLVPIHLDALCLAQPLNEVAGSMAKYDKLPYVYGGDTYNGDSLNLGANILRPVFNEEWTLEAGIHLHWALPDALTHGLHDEAGTTFPRVPNRWLISRQGGDQGKKQWVVESDYLYPPPANSNDSPPGRGIAINILIDPPALAGVDPDDPTTYQYHRSRYMGKSWTLEEWNADEAGNEYAPTLTAIGNKATVPVLDEVRVSFAAFYPNCHTVFGFHDADYKMDAPPAGLQYEVIGWYDDAEHDCLTQFLEENRDDEPEQLLERLQEEFSWTIESEDLEELPIPERTLYHSRVTFSGAGRAVRQQLKELPESTIAAAHSPSEALSAYLAHTFNQESDKPTKQIRETVEAQLEALQLAERLETRKLDLDAKLREARHEQGFGTRHDGFLWSITPKSESAANRAARTGAASGGQAPLPTALAQQLNELNVIQEQYNQAWLDIESLSHRLYSQWSYFMTHHSDNGGQFYNEVNDTSLIPLRTAIAQAGELEFIENTVIAKSLPFAVMSKLISTLNSDDFYQEFIDELDDPTFNPVEIEESWVYYEMKKMGISLSSDRIVTINTAGKAWTINDEGSTYEVKVENNIIYICISPTASQLAFQIAEAVENLSDAIETHNETAASQYMLIQFPSQNYLRGSNPVLLLSGEASKASNRFAQDGRLREDGLLECYPLAFDVETVTDQITTLEEQIEALKPAAGEESINFLTWSEQPWNPLAFSWQASIYPNRDIESYTPQPYRADQISESYHLTFNAIDLQLKDVETEQQFAKANSYTGFSILTPAAGLDLSRRLTSYLTEQLLPEYYKAYPDEVPTPDYLSEHFNEVYNWYKTLHSSLSDLEKARDPFFVALWAYAYMESSSSQAQAIGGFNDSLLLAQPTLQLEVDHPLVKEGYEAIFHEQVRWTLNSTRQYKFLENDVFNPIRSGAMSIDRLSLVDSFGRYQEVVASHNPTQVVTLVDTSPTGDLHDLLLQPRFAQLARLNFHWLAAEAPNEVELTLAPLRTPVCGWLVPNNLDRSLAIYDSQGKALGQIDRAGHWRPSPGGEAVRNNSPELPNSHLQKMVDYLLNQEVEFQQEFISAIDHGLETIDPESFAEHPSLALLLGRPIALVRTTFSLEVQGLPAWDPTAKLEFDNGSITGIDNAGFTEVEFPIRLGDDQQLNDGLVGYWREKSND